MMEEHQEEPKTETLHAEVTPIAPAHKKQQQQKKQELPKKLIKQPKKIGSKFSDGIYKLKRFAIECKRVLRITKKPDKAEFQIIVKISSIGMGLIGFIGFAVFFLKEIIIG